MELAILLYLASVAGTIKEVIDGFFVATITVLIISFTLSAGLIFNKPYSGMALKEDGPSTERRKHESRIKWTTRVCYSFLTLVLITGIFSALMPTKKDLYFIGGGYVALQALKTDTAKTLKDKSLLAIESWLDDELSNSLDEAKKRLTQEAMEQTQSIVEGPKAKPNTIELNGKLYTEVK